MKFIIFKLDNNNQNKNEKTSVFNKKIILANEKNLTGKNILYKISLKNPKILNFLGTLEINERMIKVAIFKGKGFHFSNPYNDKFNPKYIQCLTHIHPYYQGKPPFLSLRKRGKYYNVFNTYSITKKQCKNAGIYTILSDSIDNDTNQDVIKKLKFKSVFIILKNNTCGAIFYIPENTKNLFLKRIDFIDKANEKNNLDENLYKLLLLINEYAFKNNCELCFIEKIHKNHPIFKLSLINDIFDIKNLCEQQAMVIIDLKKLDYRLREKYSSKTIEYIIKESENFSNNFELYENFYEEFCYKELKIPMLYKSIIITNKEMQIKGGIAFKFYVENENLKKVSQENRHMTVSLLWIDKSLRGLRLSRFLLNIVNNFAKKYKIKTCYLETGSHQATFLYPKDGYQELIKIMLINSIEKNLATTKSKLHVNGKLKDENSNIEALKNEPPNEKPFLIFSHYYQKTFNFEQKDEQKHNTFPKKKKFFQKFN